MSIQFPLPDRHLPARRRAAACVLLALAATPALAGLEAAPEAALRVVPSWPMAGRDAAHTNRASYSVPAAAQNEGFFDHVVWQTPSPGSPGDGNFSSMTMVFHDSAGPDNARLVVGGYHWPKGVQGMDRLSGAVFWSGPLSGGEAIGARAPAFSASGGALYVSSDHTATPLMALDPAVGPSVYWHNGDAETPDNLGMSSPTIGADGRIYMHSWAGRPYAGTDTGLAIAETWAAATDAHEGLSDPSLYQTPDTLQVVVGSRDGAIVAYDGSNGAQLWRTATGAGVDATVSIDPENGNIYAGAGFADVYAVGLDRDGNPLWDSATVQVHDWLDGVNEPERTAGPGALSHDGASYYFQSNGQNGNGKLYAIDTATGALKWSYDTGSGGWEMSSAAPMVAPDGIIVIGNNLGGVYYALRDAGTHADLLDTLVTGEGGVARATATLSPDGLLYMPLRTAWTMGNGDGDLPDGAVHNLFTAIRLDLHVFGAGFEGD